MKKFLFCLLIVFFFVPQVYATTASEALTFAWEDVNMNKSQADGYGWKIFQKAEGGSYDYNSPWFTIYYTYNQSTYTTTQQVMVTGNPGDTVTLYWVMRCFNNELESDNSNEISESFVIPQDGFLYYPINFQILNDETEPDLFNVPLEVEDGTLTPPLTIVTDLKSFNDKHIKFNVANEGSSVFNFNILETDDFFLWARVLAADVNANSISVKMDSEDSITCYINPDSNWQWIRMNLEDSINPGYPSESAIFFPLNAGDHTLEIASLEANVEIDSINITNDATWEPLSELTYIEIEAETSDLFIPMQVVDTDYIGVPESSANTDDGYAEVIFNIENDGEYIIFCKVLANNGGNNSFKIQMDGEETFNWHIKYSSEVHWDVIKSGRDATNNDDYTMIDPTSFYLNKGVHTLKVLERERGTLIDKILITNDINFDPTIEPTEEVLGLVNNFSEDSNCVALYQFEPENLTADSRSTNVLTNYGGTSEEVDYKEGSGCARLIRSESDYLMRTDADLTSDFPFKVGTSNNTVSICCWVKFSTLNDAAHLVSKYSGNNSWRSFALLYKNSSNNINARINTDYFEHESSIQTDRWYHIGMALDNGNLLLIRIWDDVAQSILGTDLSTIPASNVAEAAPLIIGNEYEGDNKFDGLIDEVVIFNDLLTADEIDQIRQGTYGN